MQGLQKACRDPSIAPEPAGSSACERITVYYDGACPLCQAEIGIYQRQDHAGALKLVDVSAGSTVMPHDLSRQTALARFHVRGPDGRLESGAAAFAIVWQALPAWRRIGRLAQQGWLIGSLEIAYRLFLPARPFLSQGARFLTRRQ